MNQTILKIDGEEADRYVVDRLKQILQNLSDPQATFHDIDRPHLIHACKTLINYIGCIDETPW